MMPPPGDTPSKPATTPPPTKDHDNQGSDGRKSAKPPDQGLKCPRCDSPNTKFCYYNNYSLTQPRHFCKTCRRYWTKGGALRNVPIGGGCRKNKKGRPSSSSSSSRALSCDSRDSGSSSELGPLKFLHGLSPSMDFHLGGLTFPTRLQQHHHPPITTGFYNQFSSFGDVSASTSASGFQLDHSGGSSSLIGLNYPFSSSTGSGFGGAIHGVNSVNVHSGLASSIESLSSLNQDLHWKLQQQRLTMLFGEENQKDDNNNSNNNSVSFSPLVNLENQTQQRPQHILFQNLEISKPASEALPVVDSRKEGPSGDNTPTEWFFGNSHASVAPTPTTTGSGGIGHDNASNNWSGVHGWGDMQQPYSALP